MKKFTAKKIVWVSCLASLFLLFMAQTSYAKKRKHHAKIAQPAASVVIDAETGKILTGNHATSLRYPASMTKMMTLYLLFEQIELGNLSLDDDLTVSRYAYNKHGNRIGLKPQDHISVRDAILALAVKSANNVAVVVAENISGNESSFAQKMTKKARQLGMKNTVFKNASGWFDQGHKTTAYDMALLLKSIHKNYPHYYHFMGTKIFNFRGQEFQNSNKLLGHYPGCDGGKTGFVAKAGFCLACSAERSNNRVIAVVMGEPSKSARTHHMTKLLDTGFEKINRL